MTGEARQESPPAAQVNLGRVELKANSEHPFKQSLGQSFVISKHLPFEQVCGEEAIMCSTFLCPPH